MNGSVRFTISDPGNEEEDSETGNLGHINAITSIGNSSKIDEKKIGKFGIGFKAVIDYSKSPHIYDDSFPKSYLYKKTQPSIAEGV